MSEMRGRADMLCPFADVRVMSAVEGTSDVTSAASRRITANQSEKPAGLKPMRQRLVTRPGAEPAWTAGAQPTVTGTWRPSKTRA